MKFSNTILTRGLEVPMPSRHAETTGRANFQLLLVTSATSESDLQQAVGVEQPTLLTIDLGDDPKEAVAQIELLKERYPTAHVAVLANYYRRIDLVAAYRAGANACFVKDMSCGAFIKTIESIMNGETVLPPELLPFIDDHPDHHQRMPAMINTTTNASALSTNGIDTLPRLSVREKCILRCMVEGDSNKAIARKIDIAEATVKVHVKAILRKIRLNNRTQAAIWAVNNSALVWSADTEAHAVGALVAPTPLAPEHGIPVR